MYGKCEQKEKKPLIGNAKPECNMLFGFMAKIISSDVHIALEHHSVNTMLAFVAV